jgi:hypothetical protein
VAAYFHFIAYIATRLHLASAIRMLHNLPLLHQSNNAFKAEAASSSPLIHPFFPDRDTVLPLSQLLTHCQWGFQNYFALARWIVYAYACYSNGCIFPPLALAAAGFGRNHALASRLQLATETKARGDEPSITSK